MDLYQAIPEQDLFPNATGELTVHAEAETMTGGPTDGNGSYSVTVTTKTEVVYTDTALGFTTTVPAGESFSYDLYLDWSIADAYNFSLAASSSLTAAGFDVVVAEGNAEVDIVVSADLTIAGSMDVVNGMVAYGGLTTGEAVNLNMVIARIFTDRNNWTIATASTAETTDLEVNVSFQDSKGQTREDQALIDAKLTAQGEIVNEAASVTLDGYLGGYWTVSVIDDKGNERTVGIQIDSLDDVSLKAGRFTLGHFSAEELYAKYNILVDRIDGSTLVFCLA